MKITSIRGYLEDFLKKKGATINQFSEISGVNSGTISNIINGNRPIAMQQLDRITDGMGLAQGTFYDLYVEECFLQSSPNWRRIRPFIYRCVELDKLECIQRVVGIMMDNLSYTNALFDTAEDFFKQGKHAAAVMLYESVVESEKYQHSERLALCQYRLFTIALGDDQDLNLRTAVQFEGFVDRLDEVDQLDALKDLANTYISLRRWEKVEQLAKEMGNKASIQYKHRYEEARKEELHKEPSMPLFSYILYSHVLCSSVCDERGDYDQALYYVSLYSDMSWVQEDTQEALQLMNQCKGWAKANTYLYKLMKGDIEVLPEYVAYIEQQEDEILPALFKIIQAANLYQFNVDDMLLHFEKGISSYRDRHEEVGTYNRQVIADRYAHFMAEVAFYYLSRKKYDIGINCILESLESSVKINCESCIIRCVGLFEQFRYATSFESQTEYQKLISEVQRHNEKKNGFASGNI
ncbi:transcriptional regulator with XRE-family HTH domain [Paenibacillus sp. DS2015]|uniref:transcriptional regulator n=1 Tax=Paenibacillus sp. DS2015 TaxID=3373917 RepID=UPI003D211784